LKWEDYKIEDIQRGKTSTGVPFLLLFLNDYKSLTGDEKVNPNCQKCLINYLLTYKLKINTMTKKVVADFILKPKYLGISLGFNTGRFVQTLNPSKKEVAQLLEKFNDPAILFDVYPKSLKGAQLKGFITKNLPKQTDTSGKEKSNPVKE
jgi:hypothetical protein